MVEIKPHDAIVRQRGEKYISLKSVRNSMKVLMQNFKMIFIFAVYGKP